MFFRGGTLLPSIYADARHVDAVILFQRQQQKADQIDAAAAAAGGGGAAVLAENVRPLCLAAGVAPTPDAPGIDEDQFAELTAGSTALSLLLRLDTER